MSVLNNASCPVWVIPNKSKYAPFKEIIYANDFQEEDLLTLQKLVELTHTLSPTLMKESRKQGLMRLYVLK